MSVSLAVLWGCWAKSARSKEERKKESKNSKTSKKNSKKLVTVLDFALRLIGSGAKKNSNLSKTVIANGV
jgi:hypothetical protein